MKKLFIPALLLMLVFCTNRSQAQIPIVSLITSAIKKVITALDLKVQQLQNQTLRLQNAELQLQNKMSLGHLNDISGWLGKEKNLFSDYYKELATVRAIISDYSTVKTIIAQQSRLISEYKTAYVLFQRDPNFSPMEISYMGNVYNGILQESIRNMDEVLTAINSVQTQMSDGERIQLIHHASVGMQKNLNDLRQFNSGNIKLTMARAGQQNDMAQIKKLYGIQ